VDLGRGFFYKLGWWFLVESKMAPVTIQKGARILIALGIGLICLLILALSISQVSFKPGVPFSLGNPPPEIVGGNESLTGGGNLVAIIRGIAAVAAVLLAVYIIVNLLTPEGRKRLLADFMALALLFAVLSIIPHNPHAPLTPPASPVAPQTQLQIQPTAPIASFSANPPQWVDWIAILILAILVTILVASLLRAFGRRSRLEPTALERLAQQAETTIMALQEGSDPKNAILHCYLEMGRVVSDERHIQRERTMTPKEFEERLIDQGLPQEAVGQLTRLFEGVRYGGEMVDSTEEQIALNSLSEIAAACRNPGLGIGRV
jgi:hypothetical protein